MKYVLFREQFIDPLHKILKFAYLISGFYGSCSIIWEREAHTLGWKNNFFFFCELGAVADIIMAKISNRDQKLNQDGRTADYSCTGFYLLFLMSINISSSIVNAKTGNPFICSWNFFWIFFEIFRHYMWMASKSNCDWFHHLG